MSELDFSKALVVCPHPDDAEFSCGGTMARWSSEGKEVVLVVVTNGAAGSNDPAVERDWLIETREREQREAAEALGVREVIFLGYEDGFVEDSHELRRDITREMRRHRPDVVVGPDPSSYYFEQRYVNHPDHRAVGHAFLAAVNPGVTTVPLYRSELYDQGFEPHHLKACLLTASVTPDYFIDVEGFLDAKVRALRAHKSQMGDGEWMEQAVGEMGRMIGSRSGRGYEYAEAFKVFFFRRREKPPE